MQRGHEGTEMAIPTLYDRDFFAWTQDQAAALRRAQRDRIDAPVDWEHLADELEQLGGSIKDSIQCELATVIDTCSSLSIHPMPALEEVARIGAQSPASPERQDRQPS